jgi:glucose-1-phosphate thymidylyltransferase
MDAVVLAGGYATRLWPITRNRPKMFLPVGDETVIDSVFDDLERDTRVDTVYVSTNERFADEFAGYLAESEFEKPVLSVEDTTGEDEKFGVVGALEQLIDREGVTDDLMVVAGDNLISFDLSKFGDFFEETGAPAIVAYDVGSRERAKSYGLVELDGTEVVDFQEKPDDPKSTLVSIGAYVFPADTLPLFTEYLADGENPDEPGWFIQWLQSRGSVHAFTFDGAWYDIGTPAAYLDAVGWALDGEAKIDPDATVENADIGPDSHVMAGAEVQNTTVERSVVFPEATVEDSHVSDSVVDEYATVRETDLTDSLVGGYSRLVAPDDD